MEGEVRMAKSLERGKVERILAMKSLLKTYTFKTLTLGSYAKVIERKTGQAQWEYVVRAGTTTFAFGGDITTAIVNYDENYPYANVPKEEYRAKTVEVGSLEVANAFGLCGMCGNVQE